MTDKKTPLALCKDNRIALPNSKGVAVGRYHHGGVRDCKAQRGLGRAGGFAAAGVYPGHYLAVERHGRHRTHRHPRPGNLLVRATHTTDVPDLPGPAAPRRRFLAVTGGILRGDVRAVFGDGLASGEIRGAALRGGYQTES